MSSETIPTKISYHIINLYTLNRDHNTDRDGAEGSNLGGWDQFSCSSLHGYRFHATNPLLMATCKAPFLVLPVLDYLRQLSTVYNGVFSAHLRSLFAATWFQPRVHRIQLALLLPGTIDPAVN